MKTLDQISKEDMIDLLNRCWMTHDGMWFLHCCRKFGIETANELNKEAIRWLAPIEVARMKSTIGMGKDSFETFDEFRDFISLVSDLFIPDFMNITMSFPGENTIRWKFKPGQCFAYKGMKRIGVIDDYRCGVIYRLACWFDTLGLTYTITPQPERCLMLTDGNCSGDIIFTFSK